MGETSSLRNNTRIYTSLILKKGGSHRQGPHGNQLVVGIIAATPSLPPPNSPSTACYHIVLPGQPTPSTTRSLLNSILSLPQSGTED
ncbi:hypothetical protein OPQ81_001498 [Rhizoctonia solani]|nr:hypothetical protein OPQ81_001498 [Rhizoctonia solani]